MPEIVPKERLLNFKIEEGWAPLCESLGRDIPVGVPFPRVNEVEALKAVVRNQWKGNLRDLDRKVAPWAAAALVVATCVYLTRA